MEPRAERGARMLDDTDAVRLGGILRHVPVRASSWSYYLQPQLEQVGTADVVAQ